MSAVGIVSIVAGVVAVCGRGLSLVAPAATLRWLKGTTRTNGRIRTLGACALILGASMVWAGASEDSGLATILLVGGWVVVGISTPALVVFPGVFRAIADAILPSDARPTPTWWRVRSLAGVAAGALLIYFGALAL